MAKYKCVARCFFHGVVTEGTVLELTDAEAEIARVQASFVRVDEADPVTAEADDGALTDEDGGELKPEAQMTRANLVQKLTEMGVRFSPKASKQELFELFQEALKNS